MSLIARPTRRGLGISAGSLMLFFVGANVQAGWLYVIGAGMLGAVIAGMLMPAGSIRGLVINRKSPAAAIAHEPIASSIQITNSRGSRRGAFVIEDSLFENSGSIVGGLGPRQSITVESKVNAPRRGIYEVGSIEVSSGYPFGLGKARRRLDLPARIVVHPRWTPLAGFPVLELASAPSEAHHDRRNRGSGTDFWGIREYRPGDSVRHIHWRSAARSGRVVVKEFEEMPASRMAIFIDAHQTVGNEPNTAFELQVECAAGLVNYALSAGHPVELISGDGSQLVSLSEPNFTEALDWMAGLEAGEGPGPGEGSRFIAQRTRPRSTNVLLTTTSSKSVNEIVDATRTLQDLATRVVVILVSATSFGGQGLTRAEEDNFLAELSTQHALAYRLDAGAGLTDALMVPAR